MEKRKTQSVDEIVKHKKGPTFAAIFEKTLKAAQVTYSEENGIGILSLDQTGSKVNILSISIFEEFNHVIDMIAKQPIAALIIRSNKKDQFIAGANINDINDIKSVDEAKAILIKGHAVLNKIQDLPFPTIAVINGPCLGGGLELALACTYRVSVISNAVKIGLPEVNLGILPGLGGTQRLTRLIGLSNALAMIVSGKQVDSKKAFKMGIVDLICHEAFLTDKLSEFIVKIKLKKVNNAILKNRKKRSLVTVILESTPLGRVLIKNIVKKQILRKTNGKYPAPIKALEVSCKGYPKSLQKGIKIELAGFCDLVMLPVTKNLIHLFLTQEFVKKQIQQHESTKNKPINQACVIGAGLMGAGIASVLSYRDMNVRLKDIDWSSALNGVKSIKKVYNQLVKKRRISKQAAALKIMQTVSVTKDYTGLKKSDLVLEAIVENLNIKKMVFKELESHVGKDCILASNTSSLSITTMSDDLKHPERFIGIHFFSPANIMPLVEIIPSKKTSKEVISRAIKLVKRMKKTPVIVKECPGFLVNRILIPYVIEAIRCVDEGEKIGRIDSIITRFGMPIGPLALCDEVGLDVGFHVAKVLEDGYGDRMQCPAIMQRFEALDNTLGKKTKRGFYTYNSKKKKENQEIYKLCSGNKTLSEQEIQNRLILIMVNEAFKCIEEKIVNSPQELDMAMIYGIGFPPFLGGLLRYADQIGLKVVLHHLSALTQEHGIRFRPSNLLKTLATENKPLFK